MYVSQIIMLYTLNLHSAVGQLHLNKTGERRVSMNNKTVSNPKEEWKGEFPDGQWLQL